MAISKMLLQSRFGLHRIFTAPHANYSIIRAGSLTIPRQQFSSTVQSREEKTQTSFTDAEVPLSSAKTAASQDKCKRSIAITRLPYAAVPADVEQLLRDTGVEVKDMQFRTNRFTFYNTGSAFVELGSEEEVQKAITALDNHTFQQRTLKAAPVRDNLFLDTGFQKNLREFYYDNNTPFQAIQGLLDRRRYALYVETPGWTFNDTKKKSPSVQTADIINKHLGPYGLEVLARLNWKVFKKNDSSFVTLVEFVSKESAERAVRALNGKVVEGKKIFLRPAVITANNIEQMEKIEKGLIAQLQQHGLLEGKSTAETAA